MMSTPPAPPLKAPVPITAEEQVKRLTSTELMEGQREIEIAHGGKIYRLRITQLNKLILTA